MGFKRKLFGLFNVIILSISFLGFNHSTVSAAGITYYVSNQGDDSSNGLTAETAWRTIGHVNQQSFSPGDNILFRRGDTWRETLSITSSGTNAAPITFSAYGSGERPRLLGSEQAVTWTQTAANIWQSDQSFENPYLGGYSYAEVFFQDTSGKTQWGTHQDYQANFSNMTKLYDWTWNADHIYVVSPTNPEIQFLSVEVPQRDSIIRLPNVDGSYITDEDYVQYLTIDHLTLMFARRHGFYPGYNEIEAHGLKLTNNEIGFIGVKGGSSAYCIAAWHSDMLIENNTIHDCGRRGISLNTYTGYTPDLTISNVVINNNHFYNGFHTTGPDISTLSGLGHTFTNFTISHNLIDDSTRWSSGINDGCATSSCTSNSIYISSSGNTYTNFTIHHNIIIGSTSRAILLVDMDQVKVYHNTVYASHPAARPYALVLFDDVTQVDLRNNLIYGTLDYAGGSNDARCVMDQDTSSFSIRDYNLYHQEDPNQPFTGSENGAGGWDTFIWEWDSWRAASGFETHSPAPQNPLIVDPANNDFSLNYESAAVDAGVPIPGINDGFQGSAPDLGAIEFLPNLQLFGTPGNGTISLNWVVNGTLPNDATWKIEYFHNPADRTEISVPSLSTRSYQLSGLTNYLTYTVTLSAMQGTTELYSDTITVMPTDHLLYLPLLSKSR